MVHILTFLVPKETPPPEPQVAEKEVEQEAMLQEHKSRLAKTRKGQEKRAIEKRPTKGEDVPRTLSNVREQPGETLKQPVRQNTSDLSDFKVAGYLGHLPTLQPLSEKSPLNRGGGFTRMGAGQAPRPAVIKDTQSTVIKFGTIDMKELTMTINAQAYRIEQCYTDALKQFSLPSGTIRLNWQVNESGRAQKVNVLRNDVGSRTLVECMRQTLGTWEFPKPSGGAAEVSFSFRFSNPNF